MSSQASRVDATMCYFPWFPYYHRYQIGFDININPSDVQADPSRADESKRLIHVRLYFPDGFYCMPANHGATQQPPTVGGDTTNFYPPHPHFQPPMCNPAYPRLRPEFQQAPMDSHGPPTSQQQRDSRVIVYAVNGKPGEFVVVDDTPYDIIPKCGGCGQFHKPAEDTDYTPPGGVPQRNTSHQPYNQPGYSGDFHQYPPTSGYMD